jgi:NTP pyrophosphatase (non-canonical NTP hydrolase)
MISENDLDEIGYFTMFDKNNVPKNAFEAYGQWVEGKILTKGLERQMENTLGLVGEVGEIAEKMKKSIRDKTAFPKDDIVKELGDVLFYTAALANLYGSTLKKVADINQEKLNSRQARNKLHGSGDNR